MSYLKDAKEALRKIDTLCSEALKESDDYKFYINEINFYASEALDNFEHLISELKIGERKLIDALSIIEEYLHGKDGK